MAEVRFWVQDYVVKDASVVRGNERQPKRRQSRVILFEIIVLALLIITNPRRSPKKPEAMNDNSSKSGLIYD